MTDWHIMRTRVYFFLYSPNMVFNSECSEKCIALVSLWMFVVFFFFLQIYFLVNLVVRREAFLLMCRTQNTRIRVYL